MHARTVKIPLTGDGDFAVDTGVTLDSQRKPYDLLYFSKLFSHVLLKKLSAL